MHYKPFLKPSEIGEEAENEKRNHRNMTTTIVTDYKEAADKQHNDDSFSFLFLMANKKGTGLGVYNTLSPLFFLTAKDTENGNVRC